MNKKERYLKIIKLKKEGWTLERIGKLFKVSKQRIQQILSPKKIKIYVCFTCKKKIGHKYKKYCDICKKDNFFTGRDRTREFVRKRDHYTCQNKSCNRIWGKGERRFDIHHLNGLCGKLSRKYDKISNLKGMITLCHKCHFNHSEHSYKK